ncbi:MAG TPA: metallophosphoesterase [Nitrososphaerales archaeon]|nr:metallophosphoesterase [Nitrososphaerales archaeon]
MIPGLAAPVKIAFATDIHRDYRVFTWLEMAVRNFDIVAVGGDIDDPYLGLRNFKLNYAMHKIRPNVVRDRIFGFASRQREKLVIVVLGNHDNPDARAFHGRSIKAGGIVLGGVGGSLPTGSPFPFQLGEEDYESVLSRMGHVDVLVVHEPPFDTRCDIENGGRHVGSKAVREYVDRERPSLVLTGHIHESPAVDLVGPTTVINPGPFFMGNYGEAELTQDGAHARIMGVATNSPRAEPRSATQP